MLKAARLSSSVREIGKVTHVFPTGYYAFHRDVSLNFQMNRWFSWVGEPQMLEDLQQVGQRIKSYVDWKGEFTALAEAAEVQDHILRAAYYWRSAEFFMFPEDPDRPMARQRFLDLMSTNFPIPMQDRATVPVRIGHRAGTMPAMILRASGRALDTIIFCGGFDSYIEELLPALHWLRTAGFDVIAFEGPGQGAALHDSNLTMTPDWHVPVGAVLDHFGINECTLIGLSLGGCLAVRAAAYESRIRRVVAYDALTDFFDVNLRQASPAVRRVVRALLAVGARPAVNLLTELAARSSPVMQWGLAQGMSVTGTHSPSAFLTETKRYRTGDISHRLDQDVLLLAGAADHFVPHRQLFDQAHSLTAARSVSARVFTQAENASSHCQAGNYALALRVIVSWLTSVLRN